MLVEELGTARPLSRPGTAFDDDVAAVREEFARFADAVAPWRGDRTPAAELACYVLWSATVHPAGFVGRPAVLMSKHWMDKVWSWDHCFTALALASGAPELAWQQFQVVFDHQDARGRAAGLGHPLRGAAQLRQTTGARLGALPAASTPSRRVARRFGDVPAALGVDLVLARSPAARPAAGSPHYEHGNDSGWDNSTVFREERLVRSADLAAFLVLQLKELARLAVEVGDTSARWAEQADVMLRRDCSRSCGTATGSSARAWAAGPSGAARACST